MMRENPESENFDSPVEAVEFDQKSPVYDEPSSLQFTNPKSESFIVDVARLSHITSKEVSANSKLKLQRSFSRKGSQQRGCERKTHPSYDDNDERESNAFASPSPAGGACTLEKPMGGPVDRPQSTPQAYHQIGINNGGCAESRSPAKRYTFRRSQPSSWAFDPRKIFFFLATLSSMGTMLLIYFTLSMGKPSGDDSTQTW